MVSGRDEMAVLSSDSIGTKGVSRAVAVFGARGHRHLNASIIQYRQLVGDFTELICDLTKGSRATRLGFIFKLPHYFED
jgi:hypothetical protein